MDVSIWIMTFPGDGGRPGKSQKKILNKKLGRVAHQNKGLCGPSTMPQISI